MKIHHQDTDGNDNNAKVRLGFPKVVCFLSKEIVSSCSKSFAIKNQFEIVQQKTLNLSKKIQIDFPFRSGSELFRIDSVEYKQVSNFLK